MVRIQIVTDDPSVRREATAVAQALGAEVVPEGTTVDGEDLPSSLAYLQHDAMYQLGPCINGYDELRYRRSGQRKFHRRR
jgi:hypothetical protein